MMSKRKQDEVFRDEEKRSKSSASIKTALLENTERVLGLIIRHPESLQLGEFTNISSMIHKIANNPATYPPPAGEELSQTNFSLTKNIGVPLYERHGNVTFKEIVVQITAASFEKCNTKILNDSTTARGRKPGDRAISFKKWKLNAIDGDNTVITVWLDSSLHSLGTNITARSVIRIHSPFPAYYSYTDMTDTQCAIVIRKFTIVGRMPVSPEFAGRPNNRLTVTSNTKKACKASELEYKSTTEVQHILPAKCGGR